MRQRRWLELLKDYDTNMANVVADALSRKSGMIACFDSIILHDLEHLDVELCVRGSGGDKKGYQSQKEQKQAKTDKKRKRQVQERDLKPISKAGSRPWSRKDKKVKKRTKV
ncbi:hypothetical protein Tco_1269750 [Tanacetum coccineum]